VNAVVDKDVNTTLSFDSLAAQTQCETTISADNINLLIKGPLHVMLPSPLQWDLITSPNPASSKLNILITAPSVQSIQLQLIDALGRRVRTLFDESISEGRHNLSFDISTLPLGMYWVQLASSDVILRQRFVVMK